MGKTKPNGWTYVRVRNTTLDKVRPYTELSGAPLAAIAERAFELWIEQVMPSALKGLERKPE